MNRIHQRNDGFRFTTTPGSSDSQYFRRELERYDDYLNYELEKIRKMIVDEANKNGGLVPDKESDETKPKPAPVVKLDTILKLNLRLTEETVIPVDVTAIAGTGLTLLENLTLLGDLTIV